MTDESAVEMFVGGLVLDPQSQHPVVLLKDESGDLCLPIWIGVAEATSIASAIRQLTMPRPLTHDLMTDIFQQLGVKVERVVISDLRESTYYAELILSHGDKALLVDSRPSDAIAIAVRTSARIFVAQHVLDQAKMNTPVVAPPPLDPAKEPQSTPPTTVEEGERSGEEGDPDLRVVNKDKWRDILADLDPDDFKYKM